MKIITQSIVFLFIGHMCLRVKHDRRRALLKMDDEYGKNQRCTPSKRV